MARSDITPAARMRRMAKPEATVDSDDVCSHRDNCKDGEPMPDPLSDGAETEEVKKKVKSGAGAADGATEDAVDELADVGTAGASRPRLADAAKAGRGQ